MRRRDLFRLASSSVAAFLVGKYGRPDGSSATVDDTAVLDLAYGRERVCITMTNERTGEIRQSQWLVHDDGRWSPMPVEPDLARTALAG